MLNRPRPRKIVTVVRSEPCAHSTSTNEDTNVDEGKKNINYHEDGIEVRKTADVKPIEAQPISPAPVSSLLRKPTPSNIKKAFIPPPPAFSEVRTSTSPNSVSPIKSPAKASSLPPRFSEGFDKIAFSFVKDSESKNESMASKSATQNEAVSKSSGERFLDVADKAADFIGETVLGQLSKLSVSGRDNSVDDDPFGDIMTNLKSAQPVQDAAELHQPSEIESTLQELRCPSESDSFTEVTTSTSFPAPSSPSLLPTISPSPVSSNSSGLRASLLKHGLTALEKIGKTTADVVANTRNKIVETGAVELDVLFSQPLSPVNPDYNDFKSSFYETFQLYGGQAKITELQLQSVKASVSMKLMLKTFSKSPSKCSTLDFNARRQSQARVAKNLHPDRILENLQNEDEDNIFILGESHLYNTLRSFVPISDWFDAEIDFMRRLLRSLDAVFVEGPEDLVACNRRRHLLCQIVVFWCQTLKELLGFASSVKFDFESLSYDIATLSSHLLKCIQKSFESCCNDSDRAINDHNSTTKLLIDSTYTCVPILQFFLFSGLSH